MKEVVRKTKALKPLVILLMTAGLLASTYSVYNSSEKLKRASVLEGGIQTCFNRVNQSYTAKMLGDKYSPYIEANFTNITEECIADVINAYEENIGAEVEVLAKKLNTLASDVHWFHGKILKEDSAAIVGGVQVNEFGPRFQRIEKSKDSALENVTEYKKKISDLLSSLKLAFYSLAILFPLFLIWEYSEKRAQVRRNREIEDEALAEISSDDFTTDSKVEDIIKTALDQNELIYCSKLFSRYYSDVTKKIQGMTLSDKAGRVELLRKGSKEEVEAQIERIWQESADEIILPEAKVSLPVTSLDGITSKVVDHLSNKLLAEGVRIEIDGESDLYVKGSEETIEQVLYQTLLYGIKTAQEGIASKRVCVEGKKLGSLVVTNINSYGQVFSADFLAYEKGISNIAVEKPLSLQICEEFVAEINGKIQYDNIYDGKVIVGSRIKITMHAGEVEEKENEKPAMSEVRLVNVTKGTKKEILEQMKQSL